MKEEKCPMCPNHCLKDSLGCGRGRDYFGISNHNIEPKSLKEEVITDLRKCGHALHHNQELDTNKILSIFSEKELNQLHELLTKFYNNME